MDNELTPERAKRYRDEARKLVDNVHHVEIDVDAEVGEGEPGTFAWVQAWVYVPVLPD